MDSANRNRTVSVTRRFAMNIESYTDKYNEISKKLFWDFLANGEGENIVISPLSIIALLGVITESVSGKTRDEIVNFLSDSDDINIVKIIRNIEETVQNSGELTSANAVIINETLKGKIKEAYIPKVKDLFDAEVFLSKDIVKDVNEWVCEKTNGMIKEIADESMKGMLLALINAISFMADWEDMYEDDDIGRDEFNNLDGSVSEVEMMSSTESSYIENEFYTGFVKEYKGGEYSYMALLPKKKKSKTFIKRALTNTNLTDLFRSAQDMTVYATIPEYKVEFSENLNALLEQNGINQIFADSADYSPVTDKAPLKTDGIIHKAYIEVDRRGTKAAAVTFDYVVAGCAADFEYRNVTLDRPFIYAIMHNDTGLPVFIGNVNKL